MKAWGLAVLKLLSPVKWEKFSLERLLNESLGVDVEVHDHLPSEGGEDSLSPVRVAYLLFKCALFLPLDELCSILARAVTSSWCDFCM